MRGFRQHPARRIPTIALLAVVAVAVISTATLSSGRTPVGGWLFSGAVGNGVIINESKDGETYFATFIGCDRAGPAGLEIIDVDVREQVGPGEAEVYVWWRSGDDRREIWGGASTRRMHAGYEPAVGSTGRIAGGCNPTGSEMAIFAVVLAADTERVVSADDMWVTYRANGQTAMERIPLDLIVCPTDPRPDSALHQECRDHP